VPAITRDQVSGISKFKMADEEIRHGHKKQTAKFKGKIKSRWRKPEKIINMGNRERGESFSIQFRALEAANFRLDKSNLYMEHVLVL